MGRFVNPPQRRGLGDFPTAGRFVPTQPYGSNRAGNVGGVSKVPMPAMSPQPAPGSQLPGYLRALTDAQVAALANQQAQDQITALRSPILEAQRQAAQQALAQRQEIVALGGALAQMEGGIAPDITAAWGTGAQDIRDIGAGLGQALASNIDSSQAANDAYAQKMAPGGGPSGQAPNGSQEGGVVTGLAGTIPGDSFDAQGQALGDFYKAMPGVEAANVREDYMAALAQSRQQNSDYEQQLIDVANKYPQLRAQALDALYQHELDKLNARLGIEKQASDVKQQQFDNQMALNNYNLQLRATKDNEAALGLKTQAQVNDYNLAVAKLNAQQKIAVKKAEAAGRQINSAASRGAGYMIDQHGRPVLDANGQRIPFVTPSKTAAGSNPAKVYAAAVKGAKSILGSPIDNPNPGLITGRGKYLAAPGAKGVFVAPDPGHPGQFIRTTNDPKKAKYDSKYTFASALEYLLQAYPGLSRAQARNALIAAGWKPDGKRPAPTAGYRVGGSY